MKISVILERQDNLVQVARQPSRHWFFSCCYDGVRDLIDMDLGQGEAISLDLEAKNITRLGSYVLSSKQQERKMRLPIFNSNKTQLGVLSSWGLVLFSALALRFFGFTIGEITPVLFSVTAIIVAHIIGYAITDAAVHFGKGATR